MAGAIEVWADRVAQRTEGRVRLDVRFDGAEGDELTVVDKLRRGELEGAPLTGVGLGALDGGALVLELPLLFDSADERDHAREAVGADLARSLGARGFVPLAWTQVGPVHLWSARAIATVEDLRHARIWLWDGDPVMRAFLTRLGATVVTRQVWEVLPALEDGTIDTVFASPLVMIALQWSTQVKYVSALPIAQQGAAVVVADRAWASVSAADRVALVEETRAYAEAADARLEENHAWALAHLVEAGLTVVPPSAALEAELRRQASAARVALDGQLYPRELRLAVERAAAGP